MALLQPQIWDFEKVLFQAQLFGYFLRSSLGHQVTALVAPLLVAAKIVRIDTPLALAAGLARLEALAQERSQSSADRRSRKARYSTPTCSATSIMSRSAPAARPAASARARSRR